MGALAFVLLVLSVFGDQGIFRIRLLARDLAALEQKVRDVESDNATLRGQLRDMKEGRASYELAAREKLGLVKPGEVVYDFRTNPLDAGRSDHFFRAVALLAGFSPRTSRIPLIEQ